MNAIIEKLTTPKGAIILLVAIIAIVGLFYTDISGLSGGSIFSQSNILIGQGDDEPISYWVIGFTQSGIATEEFKTIGTEIESGKSGTTSKNSNVNYNLKGEYSLDINSLGYLREISSSTTNPYVSRVYDKGGLLGGTSLTHEMSNKGVDYYSLSSETWKNNANYEPVVTITKDGKETEYRAQKVTASGSRYEVVGTDPVIYYEEVGLIMGNNGENAPIISSLNNKLIPYNNQILFVDVSDKTLNQMLDYVIIGSDQRYKIGNKDYVSWNTAFSGRAQQSPLYMRDYIDYNQDGKWDRSVDIKDLDISFDVTDLCTEEFVMYYDPIVGGIYSDYVTSFKTFENKGISDTSKYSISNDELFYKTPLTIMGTWHIPIEYGDFTVIESNTIPKIEKVELLPSSSLFEGEVATLKITSSVTGSNGKVIARIKTTEDVGHLSFSDFEDEKLIEIGNPQIFEFKITATDVVENFGGSFDVELEGTTGEIVTETINYNIKDTSNIDNSDKVAIHIRAVNKDGLLLDTYPITVSQTGTTQYGTWSGTVIKGDIQISGIETNGLFPQDKTITVTDSNTEFELVYAGEDYVPPTNWTTIFLIIFGILMTIGIGYGAYLYSKEK